MNSADLWKDLVVRPRNRDHFVQLYTSDTSLANAVSRYLANALTREESAIVISTPSHWAAFQRRLAAEPVDLKGAMESGSVLHLDAAQTLAEFMRDGLPEWTMFDATVGKIVRQFCGKEAPLRAYGEMVDLLWQAGNPEAALRLEEFWNRLSQELPFSLMCAYSIDSLDSRNYRYNLKSICHRHTHVISADDAGRFDTVLKRAFHEIVGDRQEKAILGLFRSKGRPLDEDSPGQAFIFWMLDHIPHIADLVLEKARRYYAEGERAAGEAAS